MPAVDLTPYRAAPLELNLDGQHTYTIPPPSARDGLLLTAIYSTSLLAQFGEEALQRLPAELRKPLEERAEEDITPIALGQSAYDQMMADGLPMADIQNATAYALVYWVTNSHEAAIQHLAHIAANRAATETGEGEPDPKAGPAIGSLTGPRTESAPPMGTESIRAMSGSPSTSSRKSKPRKKKRR